MSKVIYPGSFDPITKGHMSIIKQASELFDEVIVAVMYNPAKTNYFFSLEERIEIIKEIYREIPNVKVVTGTGATVDVATEYECNAIVRGLRSLSDFESEIQMQQINKEISNGKVNTICLFADKEHQFISSSIVREVFSLNKDISDYVHPLVKEKMKNKK